MNPFVLLTFLAGGIGAVYYLTREDSDSGSSPYPAPTPDPEPQPQPDPQPQPQPDPQPQPQPEPPGPQPVLIAEMVEDSVQNEKWKAKAPITVRIVKVPDGPYRVTFNGSGAGMVIDYSNIDAARAAYSFTLNPPPAFGNNQHCAKWDDFVKGWVWQCEDGEAAEPLKPSDIVATGFVQTESSRAYWRIVITANPNTPYVGQVQDADNKWVFQAPYADLLPAMVGTRSAAAARKP